VTYISEGFKALLHRFYFPGKFGDEYIIRNSGNLDERDFAPLRDISNYFFPIVIEDA